MSFGTTTQCKLEKLHSLANMANMCVDADCWCKNAEIPKVITEFQKFKMASKQVMNYNLSWYCYIQDKLLFKKSTNHSSATDNKIGGGVRIHK